MASPSGDPVIGKFVLERHIHRARDVPLLVGSAPVGLTQLPAHIQNRDRLAGFEASR